MQVVTPVYLTYSSLARKGRAEGFDRHESTRKHRHTPKSTSTNLSECEEWWNDSISIASSPPSSSYHWMSSTFECKQAVFYFINSKTLNQHLYWH